MSDVLENGFCVKTIKSKTVKVEKFLAEGGQGGVYIVDYNGQKKALKWYKKGCLGKNPGAFYENIKGNVERGAPSPEFLWPLDITEWMDGTFGYIMDLRPDGYYEITEYMLCDVRFKSYRAAIDASMHIVSAFRKLHNAGYSYQDLNDGNFFINPENGDVLICDNDNVAPDGTETGIIGKPRYMAPEIVLGNKPNSRSDRFSMSVILYILFCLNHPLEGKRSLVPCLTPALQNKLYGSEPLFMMDRDDDSNGPHPVLHKNSKAVWNQFPDYIQEIFLKAFSQKAFQKPNARPKEVEWLKALARFRSEIVACQCGRNEVFTQQGEPRKCEKCGQKVDIRYKLELRDYSIPAIRGSRIYRFQLGVYNEEEALDIIARVVEKKDSGALGIRNVSNKKWDAVTTKGEAKKVAPEDVIPLKDGITFSIDGETITIKEN